MADLEGKLRSLELYYVQKDGCPNGHPSGAGKVCVDCVADELDRQRALGRAEGLRMAAEYVLSVRETGNMENTVQVFDVLAKAIRALKEKV